MIDCSCRDRWERERKKPLKRKKIWFDAKATIIINFCFVIVIIVAVVVVIDMGNKKNEREREGENKDDSWRSSTHLSVFPFFSSFFLSVCEHPMTLGICLSSSSSSSFIDFEHWTDRLSYPIQIEKETKEKREKNKDDIAW